VGLAVHLAAGLLDARDLPGLKSPETLRVLVSADEQPEMFSFTPGPNPGLEREMIEGFAKLHRLKVEVVPVARFDQIIGALSRGDGDVILGIVDTPSRRKLVAFTAETLPSRHVAVTRRPHSRIASLEELRASRVGVVAGTSWAETALEAGVPPANLLAFQDTPTLVAALRAGKVNASVMSVTDFALLSRQSKDLEAGMLVGAAGRVSWAVRMQDQELLRAMNTYIETLRNSPAWSPLVLKYFSDDALRLIRRARRD
jgi:ABC-type amino acid transport substrate-binding protein